MALLYVLQIYQKVTVLQAIYNLLSNILVPSYHL